MLLVALTALGPIPVQGAGTTGDWTKQSFAPTTPGQAGSQGAAGNTNNMAAMLSRLAAILSMALGGVYMAKGVEQMRCCSSGCTGSGAQSEVEKKGLEKSTEKAAEGVTKTTAPPPPQRQPIDYWKLRFPDEARNSCPTWQLRPSGPGFILLHDLFQPPKAEAAIGACLDAALAMLTGGLMLLNGIMGMMAANQSGRMADTALGNSSGMSSLGAATSPTPDKKNSSLGSTGGSSEKIKIDPSLLRTGTANSILDKFEKKFGINRDDFARAVSSGKDPRDIFRNAPKNALSNEEMNKALSGAKDMSDSDKARALAGTEIGQAQKELLSKLGGDAAYAVNPGGGVTNSVSMGASKKKGDSDLDPLSDPLPAAAPPLDASPDVQAALAAKDLQDRRNGITEQSIFDLVHNRYREKQKMMFGFDPDGIPKGVGNADGL